MNGNKVVQLEANIVSVSRDVLDFTGKKGVPAQEFYHAAHAEMLAFRPSYDARKADLAEVWLATATCAVFEIGVISAETRDAYLIDIAQGQFSLDFIRTGLANILTMHLYTRQCEGFRKAVSKQVAEVMVTAVEEPVVADQPIEAPVEFNKESVEEFSPKKNPKAIARKCSKAYSALINKGIDEETAALQVKLMALEEGEDWNPAAKKAKARKS